ncbi:MAG: phosphoribosylamine--glycine ligase, partial [Nanoarchaeota archaeon]
DFACFQSAQDNKRVWNGDKGQNTGGMGANSPALVTKGLERRIEDEERG